MEIQNRSHHQYLYSAVYFHRISLISNDKRKISQCKEATTTTKEQNKTKRKWIIRCHICRAKLSLLCCWVHASHNCNGMCLCIHTKAHTHPHWLSHRRLSLFLFHSMEILECAYKEKLGERERNEWNMHMHMHTSSTCCNFVVDWKITKCWPTQFVELSGISLWPNDSLKYKGVSVYRMHHILLSS